MYCNALNVLYALKGCPFLANITGEVLTSNEMEVVDIQTRSLSDTMHTNTECELFLKLPGILKCDNMMR